MKIMSSFRASFIRNQLIISYINAWHVMTNEWWMLQILYASHTQEYVTSLKACYKNCTWKQIITWGNWCDSSIERYFPQMYDLSRDLLKPSITPHVHLTNARCSPYFYLYVHSFQKQWLLFVCIAKLLRLIFHK